MAPLIGGSIIGALTFNPGLSYKIVYIVCGVTGTITLLLSLFLPDPESRSIEIRHGEKHLERLRP